MSQPDLPKLPPPTRPMRRRARAKWWFDQMRREVDKAPEPSGRVCRSCGGVIESDVPKDNHTCKGCQNV